MNQSLPLEFHFPAPKTVGHEGKSVVLLCTLALVGSYLSGIRLESLQLFLFGGGVFAGLAMWTRKAAFYRNRLLKVKLDEKFFYLSRELVHHSQIWSQFRHGSFLRIPWAEIERWDFADPDTVSGVDWYATQYILRLRSAPGMILTIDREPMLDLEEGFIPIAQAVLARSGGALYVR